jgi:hypothetical protein
VAERREVDESRERERGRGSVAARIALAGLPIALFAAALAIPIWQLVSLLGANDWGSDWRWLDDGLQRLGAGDPLVRPEYVSRPFTQFPNGPAYTWSLHPPSTATLVAPSLLLPDALREPAWAIAMAAAVAAAAWLAWPRRLWWGTHLLVAAVVVGPLVGLSRALVDQLHFANPNGLVVLGVVITWIGRRFGSVALVAGGVALAAVKVLPAIALAAWLLTDRRGRAVAVTAVLTAAAIHVALTLPVLILDPGVLADTLAAQANLIPWQDPSNLAPAVRLAPLLGPDLALWLSRLAGAGLLALVVLRRLDGPGGFVLATVAPLLLTPQLWSHWLLIPVAAALVAAGEWPLLRTLDRRLRLAWLDGPRTPAASRPAAR